MAINKVVYGNDTLVDLTNDTVEANNLLEGETAHDKSGNLVTGTAKQGHIVQNSSGTDMTQRAKMQFADSFVSDDDVNGRTVVENVKEVASADYSSETEDGMYLIPDGEGAVIKPASDDKVEVTADGDKTYAQLLTELKELIDKTKLQYYSEIVLDKQTSVEIHDIVYWDTNVVVTACVFTTYGGVTETDTFYIGNNVKYQKNIVGNVTDMSSEKPSNGTKITLHYGNKKATVDLQTTANRCLYDSNTTVKQKIDGLIKSMSMSATSNSDGVIETSLPTSTLVCTYRFGNYLLSPFTSGGVWKFAVCDIDSNTRAVKAVRNATGTLYVYYIDL